MSASPAVSRPDPFPVRCCVCQSPLTGTDRDTVTKFYKFGPRAARGDSYTCCLDRESCVNRARTVDLALQRN